MQQRTSRMAVRMFWTWPRLVVSQCSLRMLVCPRPETLCNAPCKLPMLGSQLRNQRRRWSANCEAWVARLRVCPPTDPCMPRWLTQRPHVDRNHSVKGKGSNVMVDAQRLCRDIHVAAHQLQVFSKLLYKHS
mmetsp:Transcript_129803/g.416534  ORF Transcript_129803/g.416534 Transcript_129803/m.416534 type:complete len:132 (-) Transcript_129803:250-645(-)